MKKKSLCFIVLLLLLFFVSNKKNSRIELINIPQNYYSILMESRRDKVLNYVAQITNNSNKKVIKLNLDVDIDIENLEVRDIFSSSNKLERNEDSDILIGRNEFFKLYTIVERYQKRVLRL